MLRQSFAFVVVILSSVGDQGRMAWHSDDDPNDGDNDQPVVSFSVGSLVMFCYLHIIFWKDVQLNSDTRFVEKKRKCLYLSLVTFFFLEVFVYNSLNLSRLIVFKGPQRMIQHCVRRCFFRFLHFLRLM
jgi:hypothetical protein